MACIVTSTVAACLKAFEVDQRRYTNIEQDREPNRPLMIPSDADLEALRTEYPCFWAPWGVQKDFKGDITANLHQYDFVCLQPEDKGSTLLDIAQVQSICNRNGHWIITMRKLVRVAGRERELREGPLFYLEHLERIKRICWVDRSETNNEGDFTCLADLRYCKDCLNQRQASRKAKGLIRRLRSLSLFSGAGGMDIGLSFSKIRTNWMVEMNALACETFRHHHPSAKVIEMEAGQALKEMDKLSAMPRPGEVDLIVMGPPCQPFSKLNRQSREEREADPRSLCVAIGLSYVERYRPSYGIIENVCGILENGNLGNTGKTGVIKFILLCLSALGYNARLGIVQCAAYGVPQIRKRIVILFAKKGLSLPSLPLPSNGTPNEPSLYPALTVQHAISDLPPWDISNPSASFSPLRSNLEEARPIVPTSFPLGEDGQPLAPIQCRYISPPSNTFQQQMRIAGLKSVDQHHLLPPLSDLQRTIERIWQISFRPGANHLDLQGDSLLAMPDLATSTDDSVFRNAFSRLDADGQFPIVLTKMVLRGKTGRMLMPGQHRTPSIRELARAQGFPDGIHFYGSPREIVCQIGNAVPVPLATALGNSIADAVLSDYFQGSTLFARHQ